MNKKSLDIFIGCASMKLVDAMRKIDDNVRGILFIVDTDERLIGSLSDGDVRRWLIKTGNLEADVSEAMNRKPKFLYSAEKKNAKSYMKKEKLDAIPILDTNKRMCDIVFEDDLEVVIDSKENNSLSDVPVVIMAGGKGTRLYPYTKILPKPLIPIGDVPILERIIKKFCEYGATQYYLTVNYKKGMIKSYFQELNPEYSVKYIEEDEPLGTGGSLRLIEDKFHIPIFVTNCDTLIDADYRDIYQYHKESGNAMTMVSALKNIVVPYGVINFTEGGVITEMKEKPHLSYFINTGMYVINPDMINKIPNDTFFHMTDLAEKLMSEGYRVGMYPVSEDSFLDMGEFEEMRRMEQKLNISKME